jgi:hypothetical protein
MKKINLLKCLVGLWKISTRAFDITVSAKIKAMKELSEPKLQRPMNPENMGGDAASLNNLLAMLNDPRITGAEVPKEEIAKAKIKVPSKSCDLPPVTAPVPAAPSPSPAPTALPAKIFFTGRMCSGKDFCAEQAGAKILGLADPIYKLVEQFFGIQVTSTENKNLPGIRELLQVLGQWGRRIITVKYPLTPARAMMTAFIRNNAPHWFETNCLLVDWGSYGTDPDIWLKSVVNRADAFLAENPAARVAITNVRFENEFKRLTEDGWTHYHVMCSPNTLATRQAAKGILAGSPVLTDESEKLAIFLDGDVGKKMKENKPGLLRVIWNDNVPAPSKRLLTLAQWLQNVAINELPNSEMAKE